MRTSRRGSRVHGSDIFGQAGGSVRGPGNMLRRRLHRLLAGHTARAGCSRRRGRGSGCRLNTVLGERLGSFAWRQIRRLEADRRRMVSGCWFARGLGLGSLLRLLSLLRGHGHRGTLQEVVNLQLVAQPPHPFFDQRHQRQSLGMHQTGQLRANLLEVLNLKSLVRPA